MNILIDLVITVENVIIISVAVKHCTLHLMCFYVYYLGFLSFHEFRTALKLKLHCIEMCNNML